MASTALARQPVESFQQRRLHRWQTSSGYMDPLGAMGPSNHYEVCKRSCQILRFTGTSQKAEEATLCFVTPQLSETRGMATRTCSSCHTSARMAAQHALVYVRYHKPLKVRDANESMVGLLRHQQRGRLHGPHQLQQANPRPRCRKIRHG